MTSPGSLLNCHIGGKRAERAGACALAASARPNLRRLRPLFSPSGGGASPKKAISEGPKRPPPGCRAQPTTRCPSVLAAGCHGALERLLDGVESQSRAGKHSGRMHKLGLARGCLGCLRAHPNLNRGRAIAFWAPRGRAVGDRPSTRHHPSCCQGVGVGLPSVPPPLSSIRLGTTAGVQHERYFCLGAAAKPWAAWPQVSRQPALLPPRRSCGYYCTTCSTRHARSCFSLKCPTRHRVSAGSWWPLQQQQQLRPQLPDRDRSKCTQAAM